MLSVKYHLGYWAIALAAAGIHQLLLFIPGTVLAQQIALLPLMACTVYTSWTWHPNEKKKTTRQLYIHQAMVAHLLIALGSAVDWYQMPENMPKPAVLIHILLAFMVVGNLEAIRQNAEEGH